MSIVKPKNFSYLRGPKGEKGDRGEPGSGVAGATGRITYNATTKIIGFNEVGLATTTYVNNSINNLINGAPVVLDTLNELAAAIGNNANFITDVVLKAGGTMTGPLTLSDAPTSNLHAATKQYVDTQIATLVDTAPATLNTLNELAIALGNDSNFATTITAELANKVNTSELGDISLDGGDY